MDRYIDLDYRFQSTPSRGERRRAYDNYRLLFRFQSTPSRGERRATTRFTATQAAVSIHALAGRATWANGETVQFDTVSIHALAGRATQLKLIIYLLFQFQSTPSRGERHDSDPFLILLSSFNPRPRGESDFILEITSSYCLVSIHALAGRATFVCCASQVDFAQFQSTPSRGERRLLRMDLGLRIRCFNPRPRGESDGFKDSSIEFYLLFQSTPSRGERLSFFLCITYLERFQSTPSRGERLIIISM